MTPDNPYTPAQGTKTTDIKCNHYAHTKHHDTLHTMHCTLHFSSSHFTYIFQSHAGARGGKHSPEKKTLPGHTTYINRTCTTGDKGAHPTLPPASPQPLSRSSKKGRREAPHNKALLPLSTIYKAHQGRKPPTDPSFPRHPPQGATSSAVNAANAKSYLFGDFATFTS